MPLLRRKETVMLAERLVTIRKTEARTELHTRFLPDEGGKNTGHNGVWQPRYGTKAWASFS